MNNLSSIFSLHLFTWVVFGIALLWTIAWAMQVAMLIMSAYHDRSYNLPPQYSIGIAILWSLFGFLITIGG
jgi:hypothetical protein